jgi:hypothetical protein
MMPKLRASKAVDVVREATEVIALEGFRPQMSREIQRGERFPRDHDLVAKFPAYFGLLLPLTELNKGGEHGS